MAGKLHANYVAYSGGTGASITPALAPGRKLARAYAEGFNHARRGGNLVDCPHPVSTPARTAWSAGFTDQGVARPPTHVG